MIAVTGNSWGEAGYKRIASDPVVRRMGKEDYLIILGGCGVTEHGTKHDLMISAYRDLPCSVLFLDGAQDDYDFLSEYPIFPWNGGNIQVISRGIYRLMRGQIFNLEGISVLSMGGALSKDRSEAGKYWVWWPEQEISDTDIREAEGNLMRIGGKVEYVFSSSHPFSWGEGGDQKLDRLLGKIKYNGWYFPSPQI